MPWTAEEKEADMLANSNRQERRRLLAEKRRPVKKAARSQRRSADRARRNA